MKKLLLLFISFFVFWGCEDEKEDEPFNPQQFLVGTWDLTKIERWKIVGDNEVVNYFWNGPTINPDIWNKLDLTNGSLVYIYVEFFEDSSLIQHYIDFNGNFHYLSNGKIIVTENSFEWTWFNEDSDGNLVETSYQGELEINSEDSIYTLIDEYEIENDQFIIKEFYKKRSD